MPHEPSKDSGDVKREEPKSRHSNKTKDQNTQKLPDPDKENAVEHERIKERRSKSKEDKEEPAGKTLERKTTILVKENLFLS